MSCVEHQGLVLGEEPGGSMAVSWLLEAAVDVLGLIHRVRAETPNSSCPWEQVLGACSVEVITLCPLPLREGWI